jgi:rhodanese-related sulfurtransferase
MYQNITEETFSHLKEAPETIVLDVRSPMELMQGKIEGAENIDLMSATFEAQMAALPKDKTYLVYCRSGNRSGQACQILTQLGFEKVYNLNGGLMYWSGPLSN